MCKNIQKKTRNQTKNYLRAKHCSIRRNFAYPTLDHQKWISVKNIFNAPKLISSQRMGRNKKNKKNKIDNSSHILNNKNETITEIKFKSNHG